MSSLSPGSEFVGSLIDGRFALLRWLGGTERSSVFLTELDGDPAQKAVIKIVPADAYEAARIAHWSAASTLSHPHLVRILHSGHCNVSGQDLLYVVSEYAEEVLSEILPERPLTPEETREMLGPILDALSWLHSQGIVHSHLKPSNVLVVNDQLKLSADTLIDAGPVEVDESSASKSPGIYDAPETATSSILPAADVWSLGVLLVETLTQRPPAWTQSSTADPLVPASVPEPFSSIARECLRIDRAQRCTLNSIKSQLGPSPATQQTGKSNVPAKRPSQARVGVLTAAALIVVIVIAILTVTSHRNQPSQPSPSPEPESSAPAPAAAPQPSPAVPAPVAESSAPAPAPAQTEVAEAPAPVVPAANPAPARETPAPQGPVVKGAVIHQVMPDVPERALHTIQGRVRVKIRVQVDPDGNVTEAANDSPGSSHYFANLALEAAHNWQFRPAQVDGHAAASTWDLQFEFQQSGAAVTPLETAP